MMSGDLNSLLLVTLLPLLIVGQAILYIWLIDHFGSGAILTNTMFQTALEKLTKAKQGQVPWNMVKNIYLELIQAQYSNDVMELTRQYKLFRLDPYPIYTSQELKNLGFNEEIIYRKIFYEQWTNILSVNDLFFKPIEELMKDRDIFINEKIKTDAILQDDSEPSGTVGS